MTLAEPEPARPTLCVPSPPNAASIIDAGQLGSGVWEMGNHTTARSRLARSPSARPAVLALAVLLAATPTDSRGEPEEASELGTKANPIIVGIDYDFPPFEFIDEKGQPAGYDVDLIRAVASVMNLEIQIRPGPWDQVKSDLEHGRIHVSTGMMRSEQRERFADFTRPHLKVFYSIFVRTNSAAFQRVEELRNRVVIVGQDTQMHEHLLRLGFRDEIVTTKTEPDALRQLASGQGDAALLPQIQGILTARKNKLDNIRPVGVPVLEREACLAVPKGNDGLRAKLDTGLAILNQTGEYERIYDKWFGSIKEDKVTFRQALRLTAFILVPAALIAGLILIWNRSLRRTVARRTEELRDAMAKVHKSEAFLNRILDRIPLMVFAKDPRNDLRFTIWNKAAEAVTGLEKQEVIGKTAGEVFSPEIAEGIRTTDERVLARPNEVEILEETRTWRTGGPRLMRTHRVPVVDDSNAPVALLGISEDITDARRAEESMRQTQRLESLGVLAGGIAHDFNNVLTAIMGNLNLVFLQAEGQPALTLQLKDIEAAVLRAAKLSRQMLAYSGRGVFVVRPIDLNHLVGELSHLLEVSIPPKIRREYALAKDLPSIRADESQVQQVVMNLITNAAEAIGDAEGLIQISTQAVPLGEEEIARQYAGQGLTPGRFVMLQVRDTGCGITPEAMGKLFEPFFTTKVTGRGLGLSALRGIVKGHHGGIRVDSQVGKGTTFQVCFPECDAPTLAAPAKAEPTLKGKGSLVLVADDEEMIRHTTARIIRRLGYEVVEARDGLEAVETFSRRPDDFALVLLDLTMPRMNGWETLVAIRKVNPGVRAILSSGYHESEALDGRSDTPVDGFLSKPYQLAELKDVLSRAFGDKA